MGPEGYVGSLGYVHRLGRDTGLDARLAAGTGSLAWFMGPSITHLVQLFGAQRAQQQQQALVRAVHHPAPPHLLQQRLRVELGVHSIHNSTAVP